MRDDFDSLPLFSLTDDTLLNQKGLAEALGISVRHLRDMVARMELPPGVPVGYAKIWSVGEVRKFLLERSRSVANDAARHVAAVADTLGGFDRRRGPLSNGS